MLQDFDAGRQLETAALIGSILEMGRVTDTPTPLTETVYALLKLLESTVRASGVPIGANKNSTKAA
jgi:2-dehydropantoate 2-reductase